jgi:hypothetical protein
MVGFFLSLGISLVLEFQAHCDPMILFILFLARRIWHHLIKESEGYEKMDKASFGDFPLTLCVRLHLQHCDFTALLPVQLPIE